MTLVFRIPISDAQAYAIVRALRPSAIAAVGQKRPSHRRVRAIVAPLLRARCEEQIAKWTVQSGAASPARVGAAGSSRCRSEPDGIRSSNLMKERV